MKKLYTLKKISLHIDFMPSNNITTRIKFLVITVKEITYLISNGGIKNG